LDKTKGMAAYEVTQEDVEQVTCLIEALPTELADSQWAEAVEFLHKNAQVFSKGEFDIGRTDLVEHNQVVIL